MAARNSSQRKLSSTIAAIERHNGTGDPRAVALRAQLDSERAVRELTDWAERVKALPPLDPAEVATIAAIAARLDARLSVQGPPSAEQR